MPPCATKNFPDFLLDRGEGTKKCKHAVIDIGEPVGARLAIAETPLVTSRWNKSRREIGYIGPLVVYTPREVAHIELV